MCVRGSTIFTNKQFPKGKVRSAEIGEWFSSSAHTLEGNRQWWVLSHKSPEWLHCIQLLSNIFKTHLQTRTKQIFIHDYHFKKKMRKRCETNKDEEEQRSCDRKKKEKKKRNKNWLIQHTVWDWERYSILLDTVIAVGTEAVSLCEFLFLLV